jgi:hypothetical protein
MMCGGSSGIKGGGVAAAAAAALHAVLVLLCCWRRRHFVVCGAASFCVRKNATLLRGGGLSTHDNLATLILFGEALILFGKAGCFAFVKMQTLLRAGSKHARQSRYTDFVRYNYYTCINWSFQKKNREPWKWLKYICRIVFKPVLDN